MSTTINAFVKRLVYNKTIIFCSYNSNTIYFFKFQNKYNNYMLQLEKLDSISRRYKSTIKKFDTIIIALAVDGLKNNFLFKHEFLV